MTLAIDALQIALNGWIGVSQWQLTDKGWLRVVFRCRRVDGSFAGRVQEAPRA
ncbi:MAG: hypothetical protein WC683_16175 [bacterium]